VADVGGKTVDALLTGDNEDTDDIPQKLMAISVGK